MQAFANVLQNRSSYKFPDIDKKISVLESLIKKETPTRVFSCEYHKMFEDSIFSMEHLRWLFLKMA